MTISSRNVTSKCGLVSILFGLLFLLKALLCLIFNVPIQTFVELLMEKELALTADTQMLRLWSDPPLTPKLKVFLFNVTNPDEILAGKVPGLEAASISSKIYCTCFYMHVYTHVCILISRSTNKWTYTYICISITLYYVYLYVHI